MIGDNEWLERREVGIMLRIKDGLCTSMGFSKES